jgi:hypothetical protein
MEAALAGPARPSRQKRNPFPFGGCLFFSGQAGRSAIRDNRKAEINPWLTASAFNSAIVAFFVQDGNKTWT